jgi:hypothetical protein
MSRWECWKARRANSAASWHTRDFAGGQHFSLTKTSKMILRIKNMSSAVLPASKKQKKTVCVSLIKRVILSAGAMLIFSVSFQIDQMDRSPRCQESDRNICISIFLNEESGTSHLRSLPRMFSAWAPNRQDRPLCQCLIPASHLEKAYDYNSSPFQEASHEVM